MTRVGFSSCIFHEVTGPSLPEMFALFRRAKIRFVDWCHDAEHDIIYTPEEIDEFVELLEANDLKCEQVHGFETSKVHAISQGEILDRYIAIQDNRVELCAHLGADTVVIHMPGVYSERNNVLKLFYREAMEYSTIALDRLRPHCEKLGVRLAVENFGYHVGVSEHERIDFYLARYPASFITTCLDSGHANVLGNLEELKAYAFCLSALHLHDNRGKEDDHQPPFFGTIDWKELLGWLQEIGYTRSINFEFLYRPRFFGGSAQEFVAHAAQRVRQVLSLVPTVRHEPN